MSPKILESLNSLNRLYSLYAPCWQDWKDYECNGIDATDIYIIEHLAKHNFKIETDKLQMFYYRPSLLADLNEKLRRNYYHYQEWLIVKFWFTIIKQLDLKLLEYHFNQNIKKLPFTEEAKKVLLLFKVKNINELIEKYTDTVLSQPEYFALVLRFCIAQTLTKSHLNMNK